MRSHIYIREEKVNIFPLEFFSWGKCIIQGRISLLRVLNHEEILEDPDLFGHEPLKVASCCHIEMIKYVLYLEQKASKVPVENHFKQLWNVKVGKDSLDLHHFHLLVKLSTLPSFITLVYHSSFPSNLHKDPLSFGFLRAHQIHKNLKFSKIIFVASTKRNKKSIFFFASSSVSMLNQINTSPFLPILYQILLSKFNRDLGT